MKIVHLCSQCGAEISAKRSKSYGHCQVCCLIAAMEFLARCHLVTVAEFKPPKGFDAAEWKKWNDEHGRGWA